MKVNGVITKTEWDNAEWLEDLLWDFDETEEGKKLNEQYLKTNSHKDYMELEKAEREYLQKAGYFK